MNGFMLYSVFAQQIFLFSGTEHFFQTLVDMSGREYFQISKPSSHFLAFLTKRLDIRDSKKILVIGDS